jgi:large subunit ribosomal protein L15
MNLTDLKPNEGATHRRKRIGRGPGSGHGKTSTHGHKGDKQRGHTRPGFEGGQTPTHRRLPQARGLGARSKNRFATPLSKVEYAIVNLSALERFDDGATITPDVLLAHRVIGEVKDGVKILGDGELTKKLTVHAHHFSKSAQEKITALGGTVETI